MATNEGLRYIDSDGHILEHPTAMPDYAPATPAADSPLAGVRLPL